MCELEKRDRLDDVGNKLKRFAKEQLLYWLEVLSLTESFSRVAGRALREAGSWVMVSYVSSPRWNYTHLVVDS